VLGKLLASLLNVLVMFAAGLPVFVLLSLLGGISGGQIARTAAVTVASIIVCGSLGSTLAQWREKTFQALALFALALVLWLALGEAVAAGALGAAPAGISAQRLATAISPWQAVLEAARPFASFPQAGLGSPIVWFLLVATAMTVLLNGLAIARVRAWNIAGPDERPKKAVEERETSGVTRPPLPASSSHRLVWDNPILWREIRTWAYGRKILIVRVAFLALFVLAAGSLWNLVHSPDGVTLSGGGLALLPLLLLSLVLVNAQAVTALTAERDTKALDLLLVSDLTPKEFIFGKLGGIFYNTKEIVLLPLALCCYLGWEGAIDVENLSYLLIGMAVLYVFVAVIGLHCGMIYENSPAAIATSLGTVFFLFIGVATCMRIMVAFSGSFNAQLPPFLAFMLGGGLGLHVTLGSKISSRAIALASFACPIATFYSITNFLRGDQGDMLIVLLVAIAAYGFTTAALLIPAIYEFDETTGRTTE